MACVSVCARACVLVAANVCVCGMRARVRVRVLTSACGRVRVWVRVRVQCADGEWELLRHVSFVDCPGHDILMATMLNGDAGEAGEGEKEGEEGDRAGSGSVREAWHRGEGG